MSDTGRQSFTDKAEASPKPDSQKTLGEQAGDYVKGTSDSIASTVQPQGEKSTSQKVGDSVSGNSNENSGSLLDKAKDTLGLNNNTTANH